MLLESGSQLYMDTKMIFLAQCKIPSEFLHGSNCVTLHFVMVHLALPE